MALDAPQRHTAAFRAQAVASFIASVGAVGLGTAYLPVDPWMRAFMALGLLYVVTSSITLAKVVRDQEEATRLQQRVEEARLERFITEHDPLKLA
jgi:hypothetical protein